MKEKLIEIGQDKINKAVTEFEGKAIDCLNFLTEHFISTFAEDVDIKLNGYKQDLDNLQNKYYQLEEENQQLRKENDELKNQQIKLAVEKVEE